LRVLLDDVRVGEVEVNGCGGEPVVAKDFLEQDRVGIVEIKLPMIG
jgi:hypothetical protein